MGAWLFLVLSAGKPPVPIKFLLLGGVFGVSWKGGIAKFVLWAWGFSEMNSKNGKNNNALELGAFFFFFPSLDNFKIGQKHFSHAHTAKTDKHVGYN